MGKCSIRIFDDNERIQVANDAFLHSIPSFPKFFGTFVLVVSDIHGRGLVEAGDVEKVDSYGSDVLGNRKAGGNWEGSHGLGYCKMVLLYLGAEN